MCSVCAERQHLAEKFLTSRAALEGERKQVTVLFADVKGSMDLAEQLDPEEWHKILDRFFQILTDGIHRAVGEASAGRTRKLWTAAKNEGAPVLSSSGSGFRIGLLTAQRRGEILGYGVERARSEERVVDDSGLGVEERSCPPWLSEDELAILRERQNRDPEDDSPPSAFVFRRRFGTKGDAAKTEIQKAVYGLRKSTGVDFVFHDLRRTAASYMTAIVISAPLLSAP